MSTVDPGPYTPESTISALFTLDPSTCVRPGNVFELWLSDANGNFTSEVRIGTYNGFYSAFVNGVIPAGTLPGTGYQVRIKSTLPPLLVSAVSNTFEIKNGTLVTAAATAQTAARLTPEAFGFCSARTGPGANINLTNQSTPTSTVTATITNRLNPAPPTVLDITNTIQTFNPQPAHYTAFVKAVMPDGTVATRTYFIINNNANTSFTTSNSSVVCLPGGSLQYFIDVSSSTGIQNNFPGNTYTINWGDNTSNVYTFCDLQGGTVNHSYTQSSCGQPNNAFNVNIQTATICGNIGNGVTATATVVEITENRIGGPLNGCVNGNNVFTNNSILGQSPSSTAPNCQDNNVRFNWYVNGVMVLNDVPFSTNLLRTFSTPGTYRITLESTSLTNCQGPPVDHFICIQNRPTPSFTIPPATCTTTPVTPINTSVVDISCNNNVTYVWSVTPSAGVTPTSPITTTSATPPTFTFSQPGIYNISLRITTPTCGTTTAFTQQITVNAARTVTLSPDISLCNTGTFNFSTTPGPTATQYSGTETALDDVYAWTVMSANGGTYNFVTPLNSKYPTIRFNDFDTYTVTSTVTNVCGTQSDSQVITFIQSPVPTVTAASNPICYDAIANLTGSISGTYSSFQWINSVGTTVGFSDPSNLTTTYTPTTAERNASVANVRLRVNTGLSGTCAIVDELFSINIYPANTGTNTTQSICTGDFATYTPTSTVAGSTYTWTAVNADGNAVDFSPSGSGAINDDINNTSPNAAAIVVYTITPTSNGCTGTPFTFTVTVNPRPIATATAANPIICSGQGAGITLASNLNGTTYTWTSVATGLSGNTNNTNPSSSLSINEILTNTGTTPGTVTYTITPITNGCNGQSVTVTLTVNPQPTIANAGQDRNICAQSSYTLEGNTVFVGTGLWTQVTTFSGVTITNDTSPTATANGLQAGNVYIFRWTITGGQNCGSSFDDVAITVSPTSVGGTTSGDQAVCAGGNAGQITLSGHTGNVIRWESSTDGISWTPISNTTITLNYSNLTVTTQYRAVVQSGSCAIANSTISTIIVNQQVTTADAGPAQVLCNVTSTTLNGNTPGSNTGMWSVIPANPAITFNDASLPNAIANGLTPGQTYTFRWTISGSPSCPPSTDDVTVQIDLPSNGGTTAGNNAVCAGSNGGTITLSGHIGNVIRWESSTDGIAWTSIANTTTTLTYINLNATTQYRAVVQSGTCASANSTISTITVNQGAVGANAGIDQNLCNATSTTLAGNNPAPNNGEWTLISGQTGVVFTSSQYNTTVTNLVGGQTYTFRWTISGTAPCPASFDDVVINNLAALQNNTITTSTPTACNSQIITLSGSVPIGGSGTYAYSWESSPTGNAPWTVINGQTGRDLNVTVIGSMSYRRVVSSGVCLTTSNTLNIIALPAIANNTIASDQNICLSTTPNAIIGSQPTGGDGNNYTYGWEQSTDGVVWVFVPSATNKDYAPPAIIQTTYYRRLVSSGPCTNSLQNISNVVRITVNLNARANYTYTQDVGCSPFTINSSNIQATPAAQNGTYEWFANGVSIGTGITFPGYTIVGYNQTVSILLRVTSNNGCTPQDFSHNFRTRENIVSQFTQDLNSGCGPLSVTFTNATIHDPANIYSWSIDGIVRSNARDFGTITFAPGNQGIDRRYDITLRVISGCGDNSVTHSVIVNSMPIPAISPVVDHGCSTFLAEFTNNTPGKETNTYVVNFGDGSAPQAYNWGDRITHPYTTAIATDFPVTITATNACGSVTSNPIFVRVTPNTITPIFFAPPAQQTICAGTEVTFTNNSEGATRFTYDFKDGTPIIPSPTGIPETIRHVFTQPGTYDVLMTAYNDCSSPRTAIQTIVVLAQPTATFNANVTTGCQGLTVAFTQTSVGAIRYDWDFGDGIGTSTDPNPTYTYNGPPGQYTVTLRVTNQVRCTQLVTRPNYITIVGPPRAAFAISPAAVISIPDYTFRFTDESTNNPQTYKWSFGDGDISSLRDPTHKYADTGRYLVTMRTYNEYGCVDSLQKYVQIVGVPGYVYLPNSFIPGGTSSPLQKFMAVGSGIKSWRMSVFNKWGQVIWETTKLEDGKPIEGWDGTYNGTPQPQGIYFWKVDVELINGTEWKGMTYDKKPPRRTGEIYLIR
ncbi:PKD domain-containing protein [Pedobacter polaris]|uniref:PKD domain-containing protein n=2 Tax=Pedobacter polaris TaxID=2571273 RepID=A0A4U1CU17_9SPHI|nr:PKD domain-containing protein [Pedobacter polaris]